LPKAGELMNNPFPTYYEEFIYKSRYARWLEDKGRRENWDETVTRLVDYYQNAVHLDDDIAEEIYEAVYNLEVMPSMRALMSAGPALDRCHVAAYNCAYLPVDDQRAFDEAMYILMCGTGVGYSVEEENTHRLPKVPSDFTKSNTIIVVEDSKEGWASAFREMISLLYSGVIPGYNVDKVRPAGARLKTFGGRASGPEPLIDLFEFSIRLFQKASGRRLTTLECHDLMCKIADIVVVGGVRRSAMISLSDVTDDRMRSAKSGEWWLQNSQRALCNISAVYENRRPDMDLFMKEWKSLFDSKSGERGIFSRAACQRIAARNGRRKHDIQFGTNPCSEIILRPYQFCNLTEIVVRENDNIEDLARKARIAAIIGTIQSMFSDFRYLRPIWRENTEEERLLGVSLTGIFDNIALVQNIEMLEEVKRVVINTNRKWAEIFGINQSTATTCVKPSGTVSQKVNSASGMHTRHSHYYWRTVRGDNKDPLTQFLKDAGIRWEADVMKKEHTVFYFPIKSPESSLTRNDMSAIEMLEVWKNLQTYWCEHKPSVTINVKDEEWMAVGAWVYDNFDFMSGVSFLPYDGGTYRQAPYTEITKEEYEEAVRTMPKSINWDDLMNYEKEDNTTGSQELACSSGACEIVDIG
jgi:ribonucleoside-diphosphate reductase alpha chain